LLVKGDFTNKLHQPFRTDCNILRTYNSQGLIGISLLPFDTGLSKIDNELPQLLLSKVIPLEYAGQDFLLESVEKDWIVDLYCLETTFLN